MKSRKCIGFRTNTFHSDSNELQWDTVPLHSNFPQTFKCVIKMDVFNHWQNTHFDFFICGVRADILGRAKWKILKTAHTSSQDSKSELVVQP